VPEFSYAVEPLPPGRLPFHRWRWELWQGAWLLAAGWCTAPASAERALLRAVTRRLHELRGVRALHLDGARLLDRLTSVAPARVETGVGSALLVPRALAVEEAAAA
jgi:hypothetical protein